MGRPAIWHGPIGLELVRAVNEELKARGLSHSERNAVREACARLAQRPRWKDWTPETLRLSYYRARRHLGNNPPRQRRNIPAADERVLRNAWLAWIRRKRSINDQRRIKRRITPDKAFRFAEFVLNQIKVGGRPPPSGHSGERFQKFVFKEINNGNLQWLEAVEYFLELVA